MPGFEGWLGVRPLLPLAMGLFDGTPLQQPITCEHCRKPLDAPDGDRCLCPRDAAGVLRLPRDQHPRVRREKRRGKWSTIISGLDDAAAGGVTDRKALLKTLRTTLGTGGGLATTKDNDTDALILQGDHRDAVVKHLCAMGYSAKAAGG